MCSSIRDADKSVEADYERLRFFSVDLFLKVLLSAVLKSVHGEGKKNRVTC